jgi:hypothetical protein
MMPDPNGKEKIKLYVSSEIMYFAMLKTIEPAVTVAGSEMVREREKIKWKKPRISYIQKSNCAGTLEVQKWKNM